MFPSEWAVRAVLILGACCHWTVSSEWNYIQQDHWPGICTSGKKQSPIGLDYTDATRKGFPPFIFIHSNEDVSAQIENNGHSVKITLLPSDDSKVPVVKGGGLPHNYTLDHVHFHWSSEHTINGRRFPLELHLVHYATKYKNFKSALNYTNGVAVLGVLFDLSPDDDKIFEPFIEVLNKIQQTQNKPLMLDDKLRGYDFLPRDTAGFYRYEGSLTTPDCNEGILWTVFTNTIPISKQQVAEFEKIWADNHTQLKYNNRVLQATNKRHLYVKVSPLRNAPTASSNNVKVSVTNLILTNVLLYIGTRNAIKL